MADLYNLDAELEQGLLGTDDNNTDNLINDADNEDTLNAAISAEQPDELTDHNNNNDSADDDPSDFESMSNVPVALQEAAMERQRNRQNDGDNNDTQLDDDDGMHRLQPTKSRWDNNYNDDHLQHQQEKEKQQSYQKELQNLPYTHLYDAWTQECHAPELLPYPYETIQRIREGMLRYEHYIDTRDDDNDWNNNNNNNNNRHQLRHNHTTNNENLNALMDSLLRIDVERVKFLLSDLLKRRIQKITTFPQYYMEVMVQQQPTEVNDDHPLLCGAEISLLQTYMTMMTQHLSTTVTDHFPRDAWRSLDIPGNSRHEPDIQNQYVFIRCKANITIPDSSSSSNSTGTTSTSSNNDPDGDDTDDATTNRNFSQNSRGQSHQAGMCLIVRYQRIRHLLFQNKVELI